MQRYNIFHQIHKGLRAMLYETAIKVQHADFWNVDETEDTIENINEVVRLFDMHAFHEDNHVFPAVEKYDPAIADAFEQEHVQDHLLGELLSNSIERWKNASIITEKADIAKEEDVLNKILWRYYTDAELMAITGQIISEVPTDYVGKYNRWMMRGLNNAEITRWLKSVERNAPEYVFRSLFTTAERELPERRFRLVLEGLTEGVMLA